MRERILVNRRNKKYLDLQYSTNICVIPYYSDQYDISISLRFRPNTSVSKILFYKSLPFSQTYKVIFMYVLNKSCAKVEYKTIWGCSNNLIFQFSKPPLLRTAVAFWILWKYCTMYNDLLSTVEIYIQILRPNIRVKISRIFYLSRILLYLSSFKVIYI